MSDFVYFYFMFYYFCFQSSIQIHYSPWLPNHFCVYDGIMGRQEMSPALASNLGLPSHQRLDSLYLTHNPVIVKSLCNNAMSSQKHYSLEKAVMETGGLEAILFLTAKVTWILQALRLIKVLKMFHGNHHTIGMMHCIHNNPEMHKHRVKCTNALTVTMFNNLEPYILKILPNKRKLGSSK